MITAFASTLKQDSFEKLGFFPCFFDKVADAFLFLDEFLFDVANAWTLH